MTSSRQQMRPSPWAVWTLTLHCSDLTQGGKDRASLSQHTEGRDLRFGHLGVSIMQDRKKCPGAPPQYVHARPRADQMTKGATQQSSREAGVNDRSFREELGRTVRIEELTAHSIDVGSKGSTGTEHLRFENAIALL